MPGIPANQPRSTQAFSAHGDCPRSVSPASSSFATHSKTNIGGNMPLDRQR